MIRISVGVLIACGALLAASAPACIAMTLFGDVSHADALTPPPQMSGAVQAETPRLAPERPKSGSAERPLAGSAAVHGTLERPAIEWFKLPPWMAGIWSKSGDLTVQICEYPSGMVQPANTWTDNAMTVSWGHQVDKAGNIWYANWVPVERDGNSDGGIVITN